MYRASMLMVFWLIRSAVRTPLWKRLKPIESSFEESGRFPSASQHRNYPKPLSMNDLRRKNPKGGWHEWQQLECSSRRNNRHEPSRTPPMEGIDTVSHSE
jgi:hypothetical protein